MSLIAPATGDTIYAATINVLVNVMQQPAGATDVGRYFIAGNIFSATGCFVQTYQPTRSRFGGSVPISVTVDEADQGHTNGFNAVSSGQLTIGGAQIFCSCNAINLNGICGGNVTFQY